MEHKCSHSEKGIAKSIHSKKKLKILVLSNNMNVTNELKVTGLCTVCKLFHGVAENNNQCSHCYFWDGPQIYRDIAMSHTRTQGIAESMKCKYEPHEKEITMLLKSLQNHAVQKGLLCANTLFSALWTDQFFGRQVYLSATQAHELYNSLKCSNVRLCNLIDFELCIFSNVYDFWNIDIEQLILYCSLPNRGQKKPKDLPSAVAFMKRMKKQLLTMEKHCT
jgi:hypothetical protein